MPYFRGQAVGDEYLQGELARYRAQNPGAAADDQSILDVLEGRAQPNWETRGTFMGQAPPPDPSAPYRSPMQGGGNLPPWMQTLGTGTLAGGYGGMRPLSMYGAGGGMSGAQTGLWNPGGGYGGGNYAQPGGQTMPGYTPGGMGYTPYPTTYGGSSMPLDQYTGRTMANGGFGGTWGGPVRMYTQGQMTPLSQMGYPQYQY